MLCWATAAFIVCVFVKSENCCNLLCLVTPGFVVSVFVKSEKRLYFLRLVYICVYYESICEN